MRADLTASGACTSEARPRPQGTQRDGRLVAPPRRIRAASSERRLVLPRFGGAHVNTRHCCQIATQGRDNARRPASRLRRSGEIAGWIKRHAGLAAQMSRLCGGVCGAVQRRRHLSCKRIQPPDIAADSLRRRAALPGAETSVPAGLSEQGAFDGANAIFRQRDNRD